MKKFLKPANGLLIRNHQNKFRPLDEAGEDVEFDTTWHRRLRDGDVIESSPAKPSVKPTSINIKPAKKEG